MTTRSIPRNLLADDPFLFEHGRLSSLTSDRAIYIHSGEAHPALREVMRTGHEVGVYVRGVIMGFGALVELEVAIDSQALRDDLDRVVVARGLRLMLMRGGAQEQPDGHWVGKAIISYDTEMYRGPICAELDGLFPGFI